jgi:[FeFe] hydrogenase H-cluster maturation GTPase HydF
MNSLQTPLSEQIKIVIAGLRNSGKSSLINNLFEKEVSIVSSQPGTTTDPVSRSMELGELGPVTLTDTAGFDDTGMLGEKRIEKSLERLTGSDIVIFVTRSDLKPSDKEQEMFDFLKSRKKIVVFALTFQDQPLDPFKKLWVQDYPHAFINNPDKSGFNELKKLLIRNADQIDHEITPVEGLVNELDLVLLVTPIDLAAPKGRLILPQVETIRDLLDKDCAVMIVKERELKHFYDSLPQKPKLVITDSQAFSKVAADIPEDQLLTSFSILFARKKGDLSHFVRGVKQLSSIPPGSRVLILESCSHHRQADDIGTVKIPRLFKQLVQSQTEFDFAKNIPDEKELRKYSLVINCAGCMVTRNKIMSRIETLARYQIPSVNYGLFLAWVNGLLPRALEPFPHEMELYLS